MTKRILILNGSPKQNGGTSRFISKLIGVQLAGSHVEYASLRQKSAHADIVRRLSDIDVLVIASPLYVDGIPSHVIEFLQAAEEFCTHNACRFTVYAVSNNGFIEGSHNKSHLKMYECWCRRTGAVWGGGLGIGGGEMFHCLAVYYPIAFAVLIAVNIVKYAAGAVPALSDWRPLAQNIIIYLFFNCGVFYCTARLAAHIRKLRPAKNRFTRVMVPAFLFIPMADIFMILTSLFHGKNIFTLLKKDEYCGEKKGSGADKVQESVLSR
ncbi:MAG: hypothetical protein J6K96_04645 [Treponema sp.]|nr:hypothetical protein [Treponema sp.]